MATTRGGGGPPAVERMAEAAGAWLAALDPGQRAKAQLWFDEDERRNWHYTPPQEHGGITLGELDSAQQLLTHGLLASGLSLSGYATATAIIAVEHVLGVIEDGRGWNRDPGLYHVSVFGSPGEVAPWGWRFQGHHISLNYTVARGHLVAPLPTFFGANPAQCAGQRPLAAEEDQARSLLASLDGDQRTRAVISTVAPEDIVMSNRLRVVAGALPLSGAALMGRGPADAGEDQRTRLRPVDGDAEAVRYEETPKGLPGAAMDTEQREQLTALLRTYVDRMPEDLADVEWGKLERAGLDDVCFAWAGADERGRPHYYRLQGPGLLVEYDNTQNDANHVHSVWRDPDGDFGEDLLRAHYRRSHRPVRRPQ